MAFSGGDGWALSVSLGVIPLTPGDTILFPDRKGFHAVPDLRIGDGFCHI
jgi:hypothetical protein